MKIEFLRKDVDLLVVVDGEYVGCITRSYYYRTPQVVWSLPLASNWPPGKEKEIVQTVMGKVAALDVAARLRK